MAEQNSSELVTKTLSVLKELHGPDEQGKYRFETVYEVKVTHKPGVDVLSGWGGFFLKQGVL